MAGTRIYWTAAEIAAIARHFVEKFGKEKVVPRRLAIAQLVLPPERHRTLIYGQSLEDIKAIVAKLQAGDDLEDAQYESTTRLREEGIPPGIGFSERSVRASVPAPVIEQTPSAPSPLSDLHPLVKETPDRHPVSLPRFVGIDAAALDSCVVHLEKINACVLSLQRIDGATLDNIASHPVDFARLRALTIAAADGLSRFEESLGIAHHR